jgi:hypothetical protein
MNSHNPILKPKGKLLSLLMVLLISTMLNHDNLFAQTAKPRSPNSLYLRAPDLIPGTLPEMREPSYWIARMKNPDNVIMSIKEIQTRNKDYQKLIRN